MRVFQLSPRSMDSPIESKIAILINIGRVELVVSIEIYEIQVFDLKTTGNADTLAIQLPDKTKGNLLSVVASVTAFDKRQSSSKLRPISPWNSSTGARLLNRKCDLLIRTTILNLHFKYQNICKFYFSISAKIYAKPESILINLTLELFSPSHNFQARSRHLCRRAPKD